MKAEFNPFSLTSYYSTTKCVVLKGNCCYSVREKIYLCLSFVLKHKKKEIPGAKLEDLPLFKDNFVPVEFFSILPVSVLPMAVI